MNFRTMLVDAFRSTSGSTRLIALGVCAGLLGCSTPTAQAPAADAAGAAAVARTSAPEGAKTMTLKYPETARQALVERLFDQAVADPYRWLEDVAQKDVQSWMDAQDQVARDYLQALAPRSALEKRFSELFYIDAIFAPSVYNGRYFYARRHADKEKTVYYWKDGADGSEQVLLDPNTMSEDGSVSVRGIFPTWDGKKVAYKLSENNADESTIYVKDVETGAVSEIDVIEGAKYAQPSWTPDDRGFYYTYLPQTYGPQDDNAGQPIPVDLRPGFAEVRFHALGTPPADDPLVHARTGDARTFLGAEVSRDGRWLLATVAHGWSQIDIHYQELKPAKSPKSHAVGDPGAWKPFVVGQPAKYSVWAWKDHFYIYTDEGAPNGKLMRVSTKNPARDQWREIVATAEDRVLDGVDLVGGHLVLTYLVNAHSEMQVRALDGKLVREVEFPGLGATNGMKGQPDLDEAYYSFESFTTPPSIFKTSMKTGKTELWEQVNVPVDAAPYTVEQVWYPSKDGTRVSMFLVHRKDIKRDASTPFLLYGYGGFNVNMTPYFRSSIYPWLDAGGGYAVANLRGGGEYGEEWHRAGMLGNKQNVFDDFIAAAQFLIQEGYTAPDRLAISGGSNGGLLVGAAMTQAPELFRAVICSVPLLDMVRYHKFGSGRTWVGEYGDPDVAQDFAYLYAYSPYHHIEQGVEYPALLMKSADSDDRVDPMHARKFTAAMQHASASDRPILLRIETNAGHGGGDQIKKFVESYADEYAFLMQQLGMVEGDGLTAQRVDAAQPAEDGAQQ